MYDIVDLIMYFCTIKIIRASPPTPFPPLNRSNNEDCGVGTRQRNANSVAQFTLNPIYMIDDNFCMMLLRL